MHILVTGADGYIGSHLCEALLRRGHSVSALALYNSFDSYGWLDSVDGWLYKCRGDVRDLNQMRDIIAGTDLVFHLAALISVPYSMESAAQQFIQTNVQGTLNVLQAATDVAAKVVVMSSSEVYGTAKYTPQDENHPLNAQSPYAASKIAADQLALAFSACYGTRVTVARPFNTYGPRQSQRAIIPQIITQVLDDNAPDVRLGRTDTERDFTYVEDTTAALCEIGENMMRFDPGPYNIATGQTYSIASIHAEICKIVGVDKPIVEMRDAMRPGASEVLTLCGDASALHDRVGWKPRASLQDGLAKTIDWYRHNTTRSVGYIT